MRVANTPATADALRASVEGLCVPGVLAAVVQPIVGLSDMTIVGYEALTRIPLQPPHAPDWWLERAEELDLRPQLEIACWRTIIELGPPPDDRLLFLNVSPATLAEPDLLALRGLSARAGGHRGHRTRGRRGLCPAPRGSQPVDL